MSWISKVYIDSILFRNNVEAEFNAAYDTAYHELTYSAGRLISVDIWVDNTKALKLFTKTITYTGSNITSIEIVDEINSNTLTKTFTYSGGNISTITKTYS